MKNRYGLRWQFIVVWLVAAFLLLLLLVAGEFLVPAFFTKRAGENNLLTARIIGERINQAARQNMSGTERLAALPGITSMDPGTQINTMALAEQTNPEIKEMFVINNDGNVISSVPEHPSYAAGRNFSNAEYFRKARETGKAYISDVFIEGFDVQVIVAAPIKMADGQTAGTLNSVISMTGGVIDDYLKNLKIGSNGYTVLVDRRGTLIWHPDAKRVIRQENFRRYSAVKNVVAGETGTVFEGMDRVNTVCSYLPILNSGWGLIVCRPMAEAFPNLMMIRIIFVVIFLAGIGLCVLLYLHGSGVVLKPLKNITDGIEKVAAGDFSYRVEIDKPKDMADLADSFNHMTKLLSANFSVSRALNRLASLQEIEQYVLGEMTEIFHTDASAFIRFDVDGLLRVHAYRGFSEEMITTHNSKGINEDGMVYMFGKDSVAKLKKGKSVLLNKDKVKALQAIAPADEVKFVYLFPLIVENRLDGVFMAMSVSDTPFTEERVRTARGLVDQVSLAVHRSDLYERLYQSYAQTTRAIAKAIDAKDPYNSGHSEGVAEIAVKIAKIMGLTVEEVRGIEIAAYLHDVGKIGISEEVLNKPAQLSEEERGQIKQHPTIGVGILEPIEFPWPVIAAVEHHHEKFNGGGYPDGLVGEQIPLEARILAVADAYESMVSDRPYRSALGREDIIKEFARESGRQFDARVVSALLDVIREEMKENNEIEPSGETGEIEIPIEIEGQEELAFNPSDETDADLTGDVTGEIASGEIASPAEDQPARNDGTTRPDEASDNNGPARTHHTVIDEEQE